MVYFLQEYDDTISEINTKSTSTHVNTIIEKHFRKFSIWRMAGSKRIPPKRCHVRIFGFLFLLLSKNQKPSSGVVLHTQGHCYALAQTGWMA